MPPNASKQQANEPVNGGSLRAYPRRRRSICPSQPSPGWSVRLLRHIP
jgi:hypothetical protein